MATRSAPRRRYAGRGRPIYHEPQPGGTSRGNPIRERVVRGESPGLGHGAWLCIALITLVLVDTFWWDGHYAHRVWLAMNDKGMETRNWANNLWD